MYGSHEGWRSTSRCDSMRWKQELRDFKCITIAKTAILWFPLKKGEF